MSAARFGMGPLAPCVRRRGHRAQHWHAASHRNGTGPGENAGAGRRSGTCMPTQWARWGRDGSATKARGGARECEGDGCVRAGAERVWATSEHIPHIQGLFNVLALIHNDYAKMQWMQFYSVRTQHSHLVPSTSIRLA